MPSWKPFVVWILKALGAAAIETAAKKIQDPAAPPPPSPPTDPS
jgi:hypothetical protein